MRPHSTSARVATMLATAVLLSGCGGQQTSDEGDQMQQDQRPTLEAAEEGYHQLLAAVLDRLAELAPDVDWDRSTPVTLNQTACDDPAVEAGRTRNYGTGGGGAIADADWARVPEVVAEVVEPEGFDRSAVIVDEPGRHSVSFYGPYDAELVVSGEQSTGITIYGGCFPEAE